MTTKTNNPNKGRMILTHSEPKYRTTNGRIQAGFSNGNAFSDVPRLDDDSITFRAIYHPTKTNDPLGLLWKGGSYRATRVLDTVFFDGLEYQHMKHASDFRGALDQACFRFGIHDPVVVVRGVGFIGAIKLSRVSPLRPFAPLPVNESRLGSLFVGCFTFKDADFAKKLYPETRQPSKLSFKAAIFVYERGELIALLSKAWLIK